MRLHAVIFLLMFVSPGALAGNPVKRLLMSADSLLQKHYYKVDYDTAYISRSSGKIGLKAWGSLSGASLRAHGENTKANLKTNMKSSISLEFDYYDLALEVATNLTGSGGRKRDFEINFNFYPRQFVLDVNYQKAWSGAGSITYEGQSADMEKGWLMTKMLNVDAYYTFNYRKFSYDSPFYQFYVQKQSAGSWLAGLSYQGGSIKTTDDVPSHIPNSRFKAQHLGIGGGYAYNLVTGRKWLFHFSLVPNLMVWTRNNIEIGGEKQHTHTKFPTVLVNGRLGAVYFFNPRHFVGLYGVANTLLKRKSETELVENKWIVRTFYGMRI